MCKCATLLIIRNVYNHFSSCRIFIAVRDFKSKMETSERIITDDGSEGISHCPSTVKPESVTLLMNNEKSTKDKENGKTVLSRKSSSNDASSEKLLANVNNDYEQLKNGKKPVIVPTDKNEKNGFTYHNDKLSVAIKVTDEKQSSQEEEQTGWKRFLGLALAILAALQFSLSALIIKILKYHPFNLGVWRFMVMAIIPIPFLVHASVKKKQKIFGDVWPVRSTTVFLWLQAILGSNSIIFVFYGIKYLNIADSIVIGTSAPVFVTLFAFIFLGERCGLFPVITALLALIGVAIISKPPILTGAEDMNEDTLLGVASSFSSMILLTICYVVIRYLRKVHHALVNLCFALWGLIQSIIMANLTGVLEVPKSFQEAGLIVITAFLAFFAQTCITLALKYEQAGPVALVRTSEVVFAFIWQAIFLGVKPDFFSILGAIVTLSGVVLTALRKIVMSLPDDDKNKKRFGFLLL